MLTRSELTDDMGISVLIITRPFAARDRVNTAWEQQLQQLDRPFELKCMEHEQFGIALRMGLDETTLPLVLIVAADQAYRPSDLKPLLESMRQVDVALGVRPGHPRPMWLERTLSLKRWLSRVVFGIDIELTNWYGWPAARRRLSRRIWYGMRAQDAECGLRLARRVVFEHCPIQSEGPFALVEMIAKVNFVGGLMAEVALSKPGDLPVCPSFVDVPSDEKGVFRRPKFLRPPSPAGEEPGVLENQVSNMPVTPSPSSTEGQENKSA